jgi:hypothetical protein
MTDWLFYIFITSCFFAVQDVINDINIASTPHGEEKEDSKEDNENEKLKKTNTFSIFDKSDIQRYNEKQEINAAQDCFIASLMSIVQIFIYYFVKIELSIFDDGTPADYNNGNFTDYKLLDNIPVK